VAITLLQSMALCVRQTAGIGSCSAVLFSGSSSLSQPYNVGDAWATPEAAYNA